MIEASKRAARARTRTRDGTIGAAERPFRGVLGSIGAAFLAAAGVVHAEPLSTVQTLRSDELGTRLADVVQLEITEDRVYALSVAGTDALTIFERDPITGALSELRFIGEVDEAGRVPASEADSLASFTRAGQYLYLTGSGSVPVCERPPCFGRGALTYLETGSGPAELLDIDGDASFEGALTASPDGAHLYEFVPRASRSIESFARDETGDLEFVDRIAGTTLGVDSPIRELQFLDEERLLVSESGQTSSAGAFDRGKLMVVRRDPSTGRLSRPASQYVLRDEGGVLGDVAASRDGTRIYAALRDFDGGRLASFSVDADDDSISLVEVDGAIGERPDDSGSFPGPVVLVSDRIVIVPSADIDAPTDSVHLWTTRGTEDPSLVYRGVQSIGDAVGDGLNLIRAAATSPDGAYLYLGRSRDGGSLSTFAIHADLDALVEPVGSREGALSSARAVVSNAGPADAYEVVARVTADAPIERVEADARCTVSDADATCTFDELTARSGADIVVVTRPDDADADVTIGLSAEALQTDLDGSNDATSVDVRLEPGALGPAPDFADGSSDDDALAAAGDGSGGSGGGGGGHPLMLVGLALLLIRRSRPVRAGR